MAESGYYKQNNREAKYHKREHPHAPLAKKTSKKFASFIMLDIIVLLKN